MALLHMDGFDYASKPDMQLAGWENSQVFDHRVSIYTSGGRFNGYWVWHNGNGGGDNSYLFKTFSDKSSIVVGCALYVGYSVRGDLFSLYEDGTIHLTVVRDTSTGFLKVMRGRALDGAVLQTSNVFVPLNIFNYFELKATISDTVGSYELRMNGVPVLSASNVDTKNGGTGVVNRLVFSPLTDQGIDDVYICDTTGTSCNDFLGDSRVVVLKPNANGDTINFTPSTGSNFQCVDEVSQDGDGTRVLGSSAGNVDLYQFEDLTVNPQAIHAVKITSVVKKSDTGLASFSNKIKSGTTTVNGDTNVLTTAYRLYSTTLEKDPNTNQSWTRSSVDLIQAGIERIE